MIRIGSLCTSKREGNHDLCQVTGLWTKRDIDPECPESVAIIGMVKAVWLSGEMQGKEFNIARRAFTYRWQVVRDA